jgi:hypothetical protein
VKRGATVRGRPWNLELGIRKAGKKEAGKMRRWEKALLRGGVNGRWLCRLLAGLNQI